jgi:N-acetylglucosaminyl-diphospho-decaprenol L-rhamnosyltransferase
MIDNVMRKRNEDQLLISLSIVSHGDAIKVKRLLESLSRHECADQLQIIITDNLGNDVPEILDMGWKALTIIRNKETRGFARNHNFAFTLAQGKYFCVLNPDVLFEQEVFSHLIKLLANGQADIVAPLVVDAETVPQDSFRDFPTPFEIIRRRLPCYHFSSSSANAFGLIQPDWIAGIFMLMKNETYRELNGFDEKYRLYFEDVDLCARAQLVGMKLGVDTHIYVRHDAHRASRKSFVYLFWHIQSAIRFFASPVYRDVHRMSEQVEKHTQR